MQFTDAQFEILKTGFIPHKMEEKWFIYFEDNWLYFHRSWTGFGIYKAQITKERNGYSMREFWVERNSEKYVNVHDKEDIHHFSSIIANLLLHVDVSDIFPEKPANLEDKSFRLWSLGVDSD